MTWVQDDRLQTCVQLERFPWAAGGRVSQRESSLAMHIQQESICTKQQSGHAF